MNNKNMNSTSLKYNRLMLFYIEIAYWAAYYMRWKSEKEIPFVNGIGCTILIIFCHIMTILMIIQLYASYPVLDNFLSLIPKGVLTKENKWLIVFAILPFAFVLEKLIEASIFKKQKKKELFMYFEKMSPQRKIRGKTIAITYYLCSLILIFVFGIQVTNKREALLENDNTRVRQERFEQIRQQLHQTDSTVQNEVYFQ